MAAQRRRLAFVGGGGVGLARGALSTGWICACPASSRRRAAVRRGLNSLATRLYMSSEKPLRPDIRNSAAPTPELAPPSGEVELHRDEHRRPRWRREGDFALNAAFISAGCGLLIPLLAAAVQSEGSWGEFRDLLGTVYSTHFVMLGLLLGFGVVHSGLAGLRPRLVQRVGERVYRLGFALVSIPYAVFQVAYFIAHRYDGAQLWRIQGVPGVAEAVWISTALAFYLLYPATFNLLEIPALQKPTVRLYERGIMRISRHPQLWGQFLWCLTHAAWIGTTLPLVASSGLLAHHFFGAWHGDRRLHKRYGGEFERVAAQTSLLPFKAVLDGRQRLRLAEFLRPAYLGVTAFVIAVSAAHPLMLRAVGALHI